MQAIDVAIEAGLGQRGRSNLLVTKEYGSRVRLGVVTTNLKLKEDETVDFGLDYFCTRCGVCMRKCPGKAIAQKKTNVEGEEKWLVNQEKCYEKWRLLGTDCGLCIAKCPFSKKENKLYEKQSFYNESEYIKEFMKKLREQEIPNTFKIINFNWIEKASEK